MDGNSTHSGLSKFAHPTEPRFERFWGEIQRLMRRAKPSEAPLLRLIHPSSWVDEEIPQQSVPHRTQKQLAPPKRRTEMVSKSPKPSRASLIRSSANEIIAEVRKGIVVHHPPENETAVAPPKPRELPEEDIGKTYNPVSKTMSDA